MVTLLALWISNRELCPLFRVGAIEHVLDSN